MAVVEFCENLAVEQGIINQWLTRKGELLMGLFDFINSFRTSTQLDDFLTLAEGPLNITFSLAVPHIREKIKVWDLDNPYLLVSLGYIAGYLDAAYQSTKPSKYDYKFIDSVYYDIVEKNLRGIQGVDKFVEMGRVTLKSGDSSIAAMQGLPPFMTGMTAGGNDFVSFLRTSRPPLTLVKTFEQLSNHDTSYTNSINSDGKVSGKVIHHADGRNTIVMDNNKDFVTILTSMFIIFADGMKENDKITFVQWANLPLSPWSQEHREIFALALMHHLLESKETAALIPEVLKDATELIINCSLPPLKNPLTNEMRRLFNMMFSAPKQEKK